MPNQTNQKPSSKNKPYFSKLGLQGEFFTPHKDANHINAQDVIVDLVGRAKDISVATWNCFEDGKDLTIKGEIVANLIYEIQTKLELIEKILPMAFGYQEGEQ